MARVQWAQGRFAAGQLQTPSAALCSLNRRNTFCDEKKNAACLATQSSQTQQDHVFHTSGEKPTQRFFALQGVRRRRGEQSLETLEVFSLSLLPSHLSGFSTLLWCSAHCMGKQRMRTARDNQDVSLFGSFPTLLSTFPMSFRETCAPTLVR